MSHRKSNGIRPSLSLRCCIMLLASRSIFGSFALNDWLLLRREWDLFAFRVLTS